MATVEAMLDTLAQHMGEEDDEEKEAEMAPSTPTSKARVEEPARAPEKRHSIAKKDSANHEEKRNDTAEEPSESTEMDITPGRQARCKQRSKSSVAVAPSTGSSSGCRQATCTARKRKAASCWCKVLLAKHDGAMCWMPFAAIMPKVLGACSQNHACSLHSETGRRRKSEIPYGPGHPRSVRTHATSGGAGGRKSGALEICGQRRKERRQIARERFKSAGVVGEVRTKRLFDSVEGIVAMTTVSGESFAPLRATGAFVAPTWRNGDAFWRSRIRLLEAVVEEKCMRT